MYKTTSLVLESIELKRAAQAENNQSIVNEIEEKLTALIDKMGLDELIELSNELVNRGVVDFGYPKKTIEPAPLPRLSIHSVLDFLRGKKS